MTTEADGWTDLNTYTTTGLLSHLDYLRAMRDDRERRNLVIDARSYALRIAAAERMLAIHNRRATEAEDQRAGQLEEVVRRLHETSDRCVGGLRIVRQDVFDELLALAPTEDQRVAEERTLTEERVREVVRNAIDDLTDRDGVGVHRARVADRVAKELAGAAISTEQRDRIVTIADEAFGLGPVEPLDATLTRIERGIHEQHKRLFNLQTQHEADLREAVLYGIQWALSETGIDSDHAAAEYARSKAGG